MLASPFVGVYYQYMTPGDKRKSLEARISVLKDKISEQSSTHDKMNNKLFAIIGLILTLAGLLTYDIFKLPSPDNLIEHVLLWGSVLILVGVSLIIGYDYRARKTWSIPIGQKEDIDMDHSSSYDKTLEIIHTDYQVVHKERAKTLQKKAWVLNTALQGLLISVIMLMLLKIGG